MLEYTQSAINKVKQCVDYQSLYAMEKDFNKIGLTIQTTPDNKMILSKIRRNKPITENIIDDYIFVGGLKTAANEISENATRKIVEWVLNHAGDKASIKNIARNWRDGLRMTDLHSDDLIEQYEPSDRIYHEQEPKPPENRGWWGPRWKM